MALVTAHVSPVVEHEKRKTPWLNLAVGACMSVFQVTSLGQPMEVLKPMVATNKDDSLADAVRKTWGRGGFHGFYQGRIPWVCLDRRSTKGAILILTSTEVEYYAQKHFHASNAVAGVSSGLAGGAAQAYFATGMTTCMKTTEVTRIKTAKAKTRVPGTMETFINIVREKGIRGENSGFNAVAFRQVTGWSSRIGISKFAEGQIRICASTFGGALSCWNQPFEAIRIEMQSLKADPKRPAEATMASTAKYIFQNSGPMGFFCGVVPRIGVAA
ncbi:mitochondrial DNA replication protein [Dactylonectria estremocensis]|uniref:Mitochondrial DNA replication protein n=1 Tax=Dactylonectria estremocensis TaxID=1079267 RepID=A0A9P9DRK7_9HYPO|nr:mitochondrial DNA replication protein [Dactylonectria estremocensis]